MTTVKARRVLVRFSAGPTWASGSILDQPGWQEHADFIDDLIERGVMVMGGPFADSSGSVSVLENVDEHQAHAAISSDPFLANGVFVVEDVRAWNIFVDELSDASRVPSALLDPSRALSLRLHEAKHLAELPLIAFEIDGRVRPKTPGLIRQRHQNGRQYRVRQG
jgi:uncharacterized protein YciI